MNCLETEFSAIWSEPHVEDGALVWDSEVMLDATGWEEPIAETRQLGYPFAVRNLLLIEYAEDGELIDLDTLSRSWREAS